MFVSSLNPSFSHISPPLPADGLLDFSLSLFSSFFFSVFQNFFTSMYSSDFLYKANEECRKRRKMMKKKHLL